MKAKRGFPALATLFVCSSKNTKMYTFPPTFQRANTRRPIPDFPSNNFCGKYGRNQ